MGQQAVARWVAELRNTYPQTPDPV